MKSLSNLLAAATALMLAACGEPEGQPAGTPSAPVVTVASPLQKTITEWDEFTGRFEAVEKVDVRARVSGLVKTIHFKDGQLVAPGDLLYTLEPRPFEIAVDHARALRDQARAVLDFAKAEVSRASVLVKRRALTERELDTRLAKEREAEAALAAAEAELSDAKLKLSYTEVRAPITGRISDAREDVGNLIAGGTADSTLLTTIVSLNPIHFVFDGSERDYLKNIRLHRNGEHASAGDTPVPVQVKLSDENEFAHDGTVDFVDNVVDTGSGTIRARAIIRNSDLTILPGLFGRLRLFAGKTDALLVPDSAIAADQARRIVMTVAEDGTVSKKVVTPGPLIDGLRVIRSGIESGDRVVIEGLQRAQPGQKVKPETGEISAPQDR